MPSPAPSLTVDPAREIRTQGGYRTVGRVSLVDREDAGLHSRSPALPPVAEQAPGDVVAARGRTYGYPEDPRVTALAGREGEPLVVCGVIDPRSTADRADGCSEDCRHRGASRVGYFVRERDRVACSDYPVRNGMGREHGPGRGARRLGHRRGHGAAILEGGRRWLGPRYRRGLGRERLGQAGLPLRAHRLEGPAEREVASHAAAHERVVRVDDDQVVLDLEVARRTDQAQVRDAGEVA